MASHRYWRLYLRDPQTADRIGASEIVFASSNGGSQLASPGDVTTTSENGPTYTLAEAFDADTSSYWETENIGSEGGVLVDFDASSPVDIVQIRFTTPDTASGGSYFPKSYCLLYSDDGVNWVLRAGETDLPPIGQNATASWSVGPTSPQNRVVLDLAFDAVLPTPPPTALSNKVVEILYETDVTAEGRVIPTGGHYAYTGEYYISGITTVDSEPIASRLVTLMDSNTGQVCDSMFSRSNGEFGFYSIKQGPWLVLGTDTSGVQNSVVYAHITADPMP